MKRTLTYLTMMLLAGSALADTKDMKKDKAKMSPGMAMLMPASSVKYVDVPDMKGVKMGVLDAEPDKGPAHFMVKFDKGFTSPRHHHTADHYVTVVSGTLILTIDGKDTTLPAGSFFAFSGMKPHSTRCDAKAECVLAVDSRGAWDVIPEASAMGAPPPPRAPKP